MIAQTLVEYGLIQTFSAALMNTIHRVEYFFSIGNTRYTVILGLILIVILVWRRRRVN